MPDRSDDYQLPSWPKTKLDRDLWNAVMLDIALRLKDREELEASFELLQAQGIQAALDYIQVSVAPQLSDLQDAIGQAQSAIDEILQGNAPNALKLGGQLPGYYASAQSLIDGLAASAVLIDQRIANLVGSSPAVLDTFYELAAALGNDPNFATTMATALAARYTKTEINALLAGIDMWSMQPVGSLLFLDDGVPGFSPPPKDKAYRYVDLTAGLTGAGAYNEGILTGEVVTGSSPKVSATAVVNLVGSPYNGQTIRLLNTTREFLRPGSPGTLEDSLIGAHDHWVVSGAAIGDSGPAPDANSQIAYAGWTSMQNDSRYILVGTSNPANIGRSSLEGGAETRPRDMGVRLFRRIK